MGLDLKDIKIISILSQNARENYSKIAKEVGLSNDSVKNRIEKLKKIGIIKSFKTNINYKKLGLLEYDIYLKLRNYNNLELNKIIKIICDSKYVTWVGTCFGPYDLRISLIIRNIKDLNDFIETLKIKLNNYFLDYKILYLIDKYKIEQSKIISNLFNIDSNKLKTNKPEIKNILKNSNDENYILDNIEKKIISQLNENPQNSLIEISKKLGLTPEGCRYRIKELERKHIITSYGIIIDGNKLNKIWAVFLFKIDNENKKELINFIKTENNISAFLYLVGDWNYSISVFANNVEQIHDILMNFRNKFPDLIKEYELILLFETFKYPSIPGIVFEN